MTDVVRQLSHMSISSGSAIASFMPAERDKEEHPEQKLNGQQHRVGQDEVGTGSSDGGSSQRGKKETLKKETWDLTYSNTVIQANILATLTWLC